MEEEIIQRRLENLQRILNTYVRFLRAYSTVQVEVFDKVSDWTYEKAWGKNPYTGEVEDKIVGSTPIIGIEPQRYVKVKYKDRKISMYDWWTIEFPVEDLPKRINHYKQKVRTAFKHRHDKREEETSSK